MIKTNKSWINPRREKREADNRSVKELDQSLRDSRNSELESKRLREAENKRRKEENSKKSEIVQVVSQEEEFIYQVSRTKLAIEPL